MVPFLLASSGRRSIQNVILLEGSALGDSGRFVSLAKILASLLPRVLSPGCALRWTEFINPREGAVLPSEATCGLVNLFLAVGLSSELLGSLLFSEQSTVILRECLEFEHDHPCLTGIR